ncbi:uncharacterized protein F5147DRAFT_655632 [Suillus discolor]|uniref:Uncharacterized protein n=1 Tax=Suillus discolor TaxID=1912936 RepID=A0A9P7JQX8_9AGAM|nr:uncharacterized protein F5147DRAFT_655632 [Suillus discolor]KAG2100191.1 hypothetical protein F5147DRAFT_655632 [Suillus discolor]
MAQSNSSVHSPEKTKQKLTEEELVVLQSHLEEWKEATGKDRKTILRAVIKEAKMQAPKMDARLLKKRKSMYRDWLYNWRAEKTVKKQSKFGKKWTARLVIEHQCKKKILEKTGARPGGKEMIKNYQGAVNAIMGGLSEEQLEEANKTAIEWSSKAPPTDVQVEFAQKKALGMMKDLATQLWRQAGMRIFILWPDPVIRIDFNEKLEGSSFTDTKDWKAMLPEWNAYVGEEFGEVLFCVMLIDPVKYLHHVVIPAVDRNDDEDGNEDGEGKASRNQRRKKEEFALEVDTYGLPVILDIKPLNLEDKKLLIRTFLTKHYRFCSQKPKASVPWSAVMEAQEDFIEAKFLPTGGKIKDPSKLLFHEADQLLEFWHQRQKDKVQPTFEFKGWQDHDKEMREPMDKITGYDSSTICSLVTARTRVPVKKPTGKSFGKPTGRVEQESSDEDEDKDEDDEVQSPPSKLKSTGKQGRAVRSVPVKQPSAKSTGKSSGKPTGQVEQESSSEDEDKDEDDEVQSLASKLKSTGKRGRAVRSQSEEDSCPPVKRSKTNATRSNRPLGDNTGTPLVESSSNHPTARLPSNNTCRSHLVGPASAVWLKEMSQKIPAPKLTAPSTTQATDKKTKRHGAQVDNTEPKRSTRTAKVSYKVNYMQRV